ncbi:hypothetical protein AB0O87_01780 [Microbacterium sp. NPDC076768]|uniref:hypothetical protein n=1 Tax=Microbacterium sp. NPDC076768 TaxID=3154858 RepID=UPI00342ABF02
MTDGQDSFYKTGDVVVATTPASARFTVVSDDYFDGPGSTIEFSIVEGDGEYMLRETAVALRAAAALAELAAGWRWNDQANNLKDVVKKYGGN